MNPSMAYVRLFPRSWNCPIGTDGTAMVLLLLLADYGRSLNIVIPVGAFDTNFGEEEASKVIPFRTWTSAGSVVTSCEVLATFTAGFFFINLPCR